MKYLRFNLLAALLCLVSCGITAANVLRVDSVKYPAGKTVSLPIILENQADIAGVQFDISVPYELATNDDGSLAIELAANRAPYHTVAARKTGTSWRSYTAPSGNVNLQYHNYRIMVYSDQNQLILDNEGKLLTLQIPLSGELPNESQLPVVLIDKSVVLSDLQKQNVVTGQKNGLITVEEIPRPDLIPTDITFSPSTVKPGEKLTLSWKVQNIGTKPTEDGWSEQISLVTVSGNITKQLTTVYYDQTLAAKATVERTAEIEIPALLGLDGISKVQVTVVPNEKTGEHPSLRDNNTALSATNVTVGKRLTLELSRLNVTENGRQRITAKLSRSGRWNQSRTFTVSKNPSSDTRLQVQSKVTIPANQSGVVFYIDVQDNDVLDADSVVVLSVSGDSYEAATARVVIEDNEYPALTVKSSKSVVNEGESFQLTISTERMSVTPITVSIVSEDTKRFNYPSQAVIPAGQESVTVDVKAVDNDVPNLEQANIFTVSAPKYNKGEATVILKDNDMPALTLTLTPNQVSEAAGPTAVSAVLRRTGNTTSKITVRISDDSNGGLYYNNRSIEMARGVEEVYFNLGPVDNVIQEGDRVYHVTAGVWVASCSCAASGEQAGAVTAQLTVLDNDGLSLGVTTAASTVKEGGKTTLTIQRNTTDTASPLTVTLSSDYDSQLVYQKTVTIPAGQQKTTVEVESKKNDISGDSRTVIFTVSASGYASGTCFLLVTDQTLPDARITALSCSPAEAVVGSTVTLTATVVNEGAAPLAAGTTIKFYRRGQSDAIGTIRTEQAIAVDGSLDIVRRVTLPDEVAELTYYAVVNEGKEQQELVYTNNTSPDCKVKATSPFTATVQTNKKIYTQGEKITVTGRLNGDRTASAKIDVYFINDGVRQTEEVITDMDGSFQLDWVPYGLTAGHFVVGACYPGDKTTEEQATFDVYGLRRASQGYITEDVILGDTRQGFIELLNPGKLPLSGLKAEKLSGPDDVQMEFDLASTLAGNAKTTLTYRITGSEPTQGNKWEELVTRVTSSEGVQLDITIYYYGRAAKGNLQVESHQLITTMLKDQGRDYSFIVTNTGRGNTGRISLSLPDWMSALTGSTMPGMNQNDTTTVVLRMMPKETMQLNVPVNGRIGINCENGNGTYIDFNVTPVSDATGTLVVDVTDEYTYYTQEAPHVKDAQIVLRNPVTGAMVAQGKSGEDGKWSMELPEGYYQLNVTADNHDSYKNNILVDPSRTTTKVVNLSVKAVSVSWDVVETEVEDEYDIVTTVKYETNVPVPVIEVIQPDKVDAPSLGMGESLVFTAVLTNKGLITAQNVSYSIPETAGDYRWEPLVECTDFNLAPQQSYVVPVKVTRIGTLDSRGMMKASKKGCHTASRTIYQWPCGEDTKDGFTEKTIQYEACPSSGGGGGGGTGGSGGPGSPNGGGSTGYGGFDYGQLLNVKSDCDPCSFTKLKSVVDCGLSFLPHFGCGYGLGSCAGDPQFGNWRWWVTCANTVAGCLTSLCTTVSIVALPFSFGSSGVLAISCEAIGNTLNVVNCVIAMTEPCEKKSAKSRMLRHRRAPMMIVEEDPGEPSYFTRYRQMATILAQEMGAYADYLVEIFGDEAWIRETTDREIADVLDATLMQQGTIDLTVMRAVKPQGITEAQLIAFVERLNNTTDYEQNGIEHENRIHTEKLQGFRDLMDEAEDKSRELGYMNTDDMWWTESGIFDKAYNNADNSVCTTITLQINQKLTMTRQAFRGTLTMGNGSKTTPMENVKLRLNVTNLSTGQVATAHEMEMHTESLVGFTGDLPMDAGWHLGTDSTGTATILFIPTKYAAPEVPVEYSFGGTLSYVDPFTGLEVTRELYPVTLTVKPSPELDLTYFMERDILGDNALTDDVEPMVPSEFAVIFNNKGNGDATNVRMATEQPKIIENEKGLLIDFEFLSSQLNGQDKVLAMGKTIPTDFGTIPAHTQAYAQWWLQCSLLGHFVDYDIKATHVTSYGNEDLSLLDQVTIHELIHGFTPLGLTPSGLPEGSVDRAFLVNDVTDSEDLPDAVYFTNATQDAVHAIGQASVTKVSDTEYHLVMMPTDAGWSYGSLLDPTVGKQKLIKITRQSDGAELPIDNVWQTGWTIRDGHDPVKDARLHFVANMPIAGETFVLTFAPKPSVELAVLTIQGHPAAGVLQTEPLKQLTVTFNKDIKAETFTGEDITLACQGVQLDTKQIQIVPESDRQFKLDISAISGADGYYVLTVQTATITDCEGFEGSVGKQATWVQYAGGKVNLLLTAQPAEGGTVSPASGGYDFGQPVTLTATANEGYDFQKWTEGGQTLTEQPSFSYTPQGSTSLTAVFTPKYYDVTVTTGDVVGGTIEGGGTGRYAYGTVMTLTAKPLPDFEFTGWYVNDVKQPGTDNVLNYTVTQQATVKAVFRELPYGVLTGRVTNAHDDLPIKGATVTLTKDQLVYTTTTDQFGRYTLQVADKTLTYDVSCQAEGFIWSPTSQVWFTNGQQTKNFALLPGATVQLPDDGICTFSPVVDVDVTDLKVEAWYVSRFDAQTFVLTKLTAGTVKAGEGLILVGTSDADRIDLSEADGATSISGNLLIGTGSTPYTVTTDNIYVLREAANSRSFRAEAPTNTRFMQAAKGMVIPAGKAYCQYTMSGGQPDEIGVIWGEADLIEAVKAAMSDSNAPHYDLQGRRIYKVDAPGKLHVVKGKKILVPQE